jgi:Lysine methyltransferase
MARPSSPETPTTDRNSLEPGTQAVCCRTSNDFRIKGGKQGSISGIILRQHVAVVTVTEKRRKKYPHRLNIITGSTQQMASEWDLPTNMTESHMPTSDNSLHPLSSSPPPDSAYNGDVHSDSSSESSKDEFDFITSQWENGVETGLRLDWPGSHRIITLSTKLTEDRIAPLFHGTQWAGTRVWKAAVLALKYLLETYPNGGSLLELGCGLGVPGMLWHLIQESKPDRDDESALQEGKYEEVLLPPRVVLTDMPDLLPQLRDNVKDNFARYFGKSIDAKDLDWSTEGVRKLWAEETEFKAASLHSNEKTIFDICLNCDCIYEPLYGRESWEALADVLAEVARQSPETVLISSVERRSGDGLEDFIQRLEGTGAVESMKMVLRNDEDPQHIIEIYMTRGHRIEDS